MFYSTCLGCFIRFSSAFSRISNDGPATGPFLLPGRPRKRLPVLAGWHLLSLDAPTVAAVWTVFFARSAGVRLPWVEPAAMFVAVWMIYAADRLLDARVLDGRGTELPGRLEARHRFHYAHRRGFLGVMVAAAPALAYLLYRTDARVLNLYALLATLLGVWMLLVHASGRDSQPLPKEIAVGLFFPAAVLIPTVAREPGLRVSLLPVAALFAGVCALNCLLLYAWEHPRDRSAAHGTTRWAMGHLGALTAVLVVASTGVAAGHLRAPALACGLSALLLWGLDRVRGRVGTVGLRAAADLVLLTPLLWLRW